MFGILAADLNELVREIFQISAFDSMLQIYDTIEGALSGGYLI
jgi:hypothetical protein